MQKTFTVVVINEETGHVERKIAGMRAAAVVEQRDLWAQSCEYPWVCRVTQD